MYKFRNILSYKFLSQLVSFLSTLPYIHFFSLLHCYFALGLIKLAKQPKVSGPLVNVSKDEPQ